VRPAVLAALATRRNARDRIVRNRAELDAALAALMAPGTPAG